MDREIAFNLSEGLALSDAVYRDFADADELVDANQEYAVSLALARSFALDPDESDTWVTTTLFASAAPDDVPALCEIPEDWYEDSIVALIRLTPWDTTETDCSPFQWPRERLVSPPYRDCEDLPGRQQWCTRAATVDPAGGLPALALLWVALAFRRRS